MNGNSALGTVVVTLTGLSGSTTTVTTSAGGTAIVNLYIDYYTVAATKASFTLVPQVFGVVGPGAETIQMV